MNNLRITHIQIETIPHPDYDFDQIVIYATHADSTGRIIRCLTWSTVQHIIDNNHPTVCYIIPQAVEDAALVSIDTCEQAVVPDVRCVTYQHPVLVACGLNVQSALCATCREAVERIACDVTAFLEYDISLQGLSNEACASCGVRNPLVMMLVGYYPADRYFKAGYYVQPEYVQPEDAGILDYVRFDTLAQVVSYIRSNHYIATFHYFAYYY